MSDSPLSFETANDFQRWLQENHSSAGTVWLRLGKKASELPSITYAEALEVALCYGWIDGQVKRGDEHSFLRSFSPRSKRSMWSKINCQSALRLVETGQMQPAGLAEIERAQGDGRWDAAYEPQSRATVPPDLQAALDANPKARAFFAKLDSKNRYAVLFRLQQAKRSDTRIRRLESFVAMLADGKTFH